MSTTDLFGHTINDRLPGGAMCQRFIEPPFTTLDARTGRWQDRKRDWIALGIQSEVGRSVTREDGFSDADKLRDGRNPGRSNGQYLMRGEHTVGESRLTWAASNRKWEDLDETSRKILAAQRRSSLRGTTSGSAMAMAMAKAGGFEDTANGTCGTSIFDPTLCELIYNWFTPTSPASGIIDPFAGGSVRGIVAARLGHQYTGIELRYEQIEANVRQSLDIDCQPKPIWIKGDSAHIETLIGNQYDLLFTSPPYWNLERYSDLPEDLSILNSWFDFSCAYSEIMRKAAGRVKNNRFAVVVIGNVRDKDGTIRDMRQPTTLAMEQAGFRYYNDFILITPIGSLPLRVNKQFSSNRKAGTAHQYVSVYYKGEVSEIRKNFTAFMEEL